MHARSETPTYAVTLQLLAHRHRGRHRPAGGPSANALACTSRLADGGLVQSSKQHEHRGRRRWRVGLVPEPRPPICNSASNSSTVCSLVIVTCICRWLQRHSPRRKARPRARFNSVLFSSFLVWLCWCLGDKNTSINFIFSIANASHVVSKTTYRKYDSY